MFRHTVIFYTLGPLWNHGGENNNSGDGKIITVEQCLYANILLLHMYTMLLNLFLYNSKSK